MKHANRLLAKKQQKIMKELYHEKYSCGKRRFYESR
jgi:hypothetical protein